MPARRLRQRPIAPKGLKELRSLATQAFALQAVTRTRTSGAHEGVRTPGAEIGGWNFREAQGVQGPVQLLSSTT